MLGLETMQEFQIFKTSLENSISQLNLHVFIIGMSATASNTEQEQGFGYGMDLFCQKPVDTTILCAIIKTLRNADFTLENEKRQFLFDNFKENKNVSFSPNFLIL
jgi:DNA-binding response OmpR family regulator